LVVALCRVCVAGLFFCRWGTHGTDGLAAGACVAAPRGAGGTLYPDTPSGSGRCVNMGMCQPASHTNTTCVFQSRVAFVVYRSSIVCLYCLCFSLPVAAHRGLLGTGPYTPTPRLATLQDHGNVSAGGRCRCCHPPILFVSLVVRRTIHWAVLGVCLWAWMDGLGGALIAR